MTQPEAEPVPEMLDPCEEPVEVAASRAEGSPAPVPEQATPEPEKNSDGYRSSDEAAAGDSVTLRASKLSEV